MLFKMSRKGRLVPVKRKRASKKHWVAISPPSSRRSVRPKRTTEATGTSAPLSLSKG